MASETRTYQTATGPATLSVHIDDDLAEQLETGTCTACRGKTVECRFCGGTGKQPEPPQEFTDWVRRQRTK